MERVMRGGRCRRGLLALSLVGAAAFATACGESNDEESAGSQPAAATNASGENLTVSVVMGFGGPYGKVVEEAYKGFQAAIQDVNASGGINGRKIDVVKVDHHETTAGGVAACKEVQSNGSLVAAVLQGNAGANTSATKCLDDAGTPTLYFASTSDPSLKSAFTYLATAADEGTAIAKSIKDDPELAGSKIGVIYDNGEAYVQQQEAFAAAAESEGLDVVASEQVTATQSSFVPVVTQMKEAGVETLVLFATAEPPGIWRDAATIGYKPTFTGSGFAFNFVSTAAKGSATGVTGLSKSAPVETDGYAAYEERMKKYGWDVPRAADQGFVLYGAGRLMIEMLGKAGEDPTAESFVAGAETIADYDNGILPPITYAEGDHFGTDTGFPAVCCNDDFTWKSAGAPGAVFE